MDQVAGLARAARRRAGGEGCTVSTQGMYRQYETDLDRFSAVVKTIPRHNESLRARDAQQRGTEATEARRVIDLPKTEICGSEGGTRDHSSAALAARLSPACLCRAGACVREDLQRRTEDRHGTGRSSGGLGTSGISWPGDWRGRSSSEPASHRNVEEEEERTRERGQQLENSVERSRACPCPRGRMSAPAKEREQRESSLRACGGLDPVGGETQSPRALPPPSARLVVLSHPLTAARAC